VNCPNLTCFRCGQFGHHSRSCSNPKGTKLFACSNCESFSHDIKYCSRFPMIPSRGKGIRCMSCSETDHVCCKNMPEQQSKKIYCPQCGVPGHHCDYPHVNGVMCYDDRDRSNSRQQSRSPERFVYTNARYPNSGRSVSSDTRDRNGTRQRSSSPPSRSSSTGSERIHRDGRFDINDSNSGAHRQQSNESDEYKEKLKQREMRFKTNK